METIFMLVFVFPKPKSYYINAEGSYEGTLRETNQKENHNSQLIG